MNLRRILPVFIPVVCRATVRRAVVCRAIFAAALILSLGRSAEAKLEGAQWSAAEKSFRALYAVTISEATANLKFETEADRQKYVAGEVDKKIEAAKIFFAETDSRAYRIVAEGIVLEVGHTAKIAAKLSVGLNRLQELLGKPRDLSLPNFLTDTEHAEMLGLQDEVSGLEASKGNEQKVVTALVGLASQSAEGFRKELIKITHAHADWFMRAVAVRVAVSAPEEEASKPALIELIEKEKDPRVRLAGVEGLMRAPGTSWHGILATRCEDPDWVVQSLAARIAGDREVGKAIPNLIHGLAKASPKVSQDIVAALRKLTGQNIEAYEEPWGKWWEANRTNYGENGRPLQPVVSTPRASDIEFYGLKVKSDKVMYIIDISGSMKEEKKAKATTGKDVGMKGDPKPDASAPRFSGPKIEIAKLELKRSLQALSKDSNFNILAFNHAVQQFQPKMVPANDANKELAYAWIRDMAPSGSTFADGALQIAFKMAGMGAYDKAYPGVAIDTVIFLSDGAPTDDSQDGTLMDYNIILKHVAEWNPEKRIIIHCVGIDNVVQGIQFMKLLASQNGGIYIDG